MFKMIFRPKWQHRKVQVRLVAVRELTAVDPVLLQVAREDTEAVVRQQAVRRIGDANALLGLLAEESDEGVREVCSKHLRRLLAGQEEGLPRLSLEQRLLLVGRCTEEEITAHVLLHAAEPELRRVALAAASRPSVLAEVALNDPSSELRLAALERIDRRATLERIARQAKGRDKQVSRRARERLEAERMAELRPQRQAEICAAIEALAQQGGVDIVAFRHREEEWQSLLPALDAAVGERYAAACAHFAEAHARVQAEAALTARQRELCERVEQLLREVERDEADINGMDSAITMLQRAWGSLEEDLPSLNAGLRERFNDALEQTRQRRAGRIRQREELARLNAVLARLESLTVADSPLGGEVLQQIEREWQASGGGNRQAHTAALCARFAPLMQQAKQRLAGQGEAVQALQQEYAALLGQMETALTEGQVQQASSCRDKLAEREKRLAALGCRPGVQQQRRGKLVNARLRELRDWRRFGTEQAREELLAQMTALREFPLEPLKQAEAVKTLRASWRGLGRKDGLAADALRQAFEQAAEAAYAPCREHYEEQERQRGENLAQRRRFVVELQRDYEAVDWQQPDWAAVEQRVQQAQKRWQTLGGVERAAWQEVNGRFREALAGFETHLAARRGSEKARREALIAQVEALAQEDDLAKALAATRAAQAAWRPDVSCPSRVEQALWRRFRAACDAVFARQKAQANAHRREEREHLAYRQQLCAEAEALAVEARGEPAQFRHRLEALQQQWRESTGEGARPDKALEQRFHAALATFRQAEEAARQRQADAAHRLYMQKAALCEAAESLLFDAPEPAQPDSLASVWQGLAVLQDARLEQLLSARFERALAMRATGVEAPALEAAARENLLQRQALCLELEILAGLESPAEFAEERMAMQVQLLAGAMSGQRDETQKPARIRQLLEEYFTLGPILPEGKAGLEARIEAVMAAAG